MLSTLLLLASLSLSAPQGGTEVPPLCDTALIPFVFDPAGLESHGARRALGELLRCRLDLPATFRVQLAVDADERRRREGDVWILTGRLHHAGLRRSGLALEVASDLGHVRVDWASFARSESRSTWVASRCAEEPTLAMGELHAGLLGVLAALDELDDELERLESTWIRAVNLPDERVGLELEATFERRRVVGAKCPAFRSVSGLALAGRRAPSTGAEQARRGARDLMARARPWPLFTEALAELRALDVELSRWPGATAWLGQNHEYGGYDVRQVVSYSASSGPAAVELFVIPPRPGPRRQARLADSKVRLGDREPLRVSLGPGVPVTLGPIDFDPVAVELSFDGVGRRLDVLQRALFRLDLELHSISLFPKARAGESESVPFLLAVGVQRERPHDGYAPGRVLQLARDDAASEAPVAQHGILEYRAGTNGSGFDVSLADGRRLSYAGFMTAFCAVGSPQSVRPSLDGVAGRLLGGR